MPPSAHATSDLLVGLVAAIDVRGLLIPAGIIAAVVAVLWLVSLVAWRVIVRAAQRVSADEPAREQEVHAWASRLRGAIRAGAIALAVLASGVVLLYSVGVDGVPKLTGADVAAWLADSGGRIVLAIAGAVVVTRIGGHIVAGMPTLLVRTQGRTGSEIGEQRKRVETLGRVALASVNVLVIGTAALVVLHGLGVDVWPILTGAGVLGLAVSFGAQNLVRDVISGLLLIVEDNIRVGDVARINNSTGTVERIGLRTITLRGADGTVHVIANGAVTELANMTKDYGYHVLDLGVAYREDTDRVVAVMQRVASELRADPAQREQILADLEVLGVDAFAETSVVIKVRIKTAPSAQWAVGREYRRRLKKALEAEGIGIPRPHVTIDVREGSIDALAGVARDTAAVAQGAARADAPARAR